jgi:hypothetical protein
VLQGTSVRWSDTSKAHTSGTQFGGCVGSGSMAAPNAAGLLNGMALTYTLMSIFHAAPWMKPISSRRISARPSERDAVCASEQ